MLLCLAPLPAAPAAALADPAENIEYDGRTGGVGLLVREACRCRSAAAATTAGGMTGGSGGWGGCDVRRASSCCCCIGECAGGSRGPKSWLITAAAPSVPPCAAGAMTGAGALCGGKDGPVEVAVLGGTSGGSQPHALLSSPMIPFRFHPVMRYTRLTIARTSFCSLGSLSTAPAIARDRIATDETPASLVCAMMPQT
jgi:hypothetical protein